MAETRVSKRQKGILSSDLSDGPWQLSREHYQLIQPVSAWERLSISSCPLKHPVLPYTSHPALYGTNHWPRADRRQPWAPSTFRVKQKHQESQKHLEQETFKCFFRWVSSRWLIFCYSNTVVFLSGINFIYLMVWFIENKNNRFSIISVYQKNKFDAFNVFKRSVMLIEAVFVW